MPKVPASPPAVAHADSRPTTDPVSTPESQRTAGSGAGANAARVPVAGRKPASGSSA